MGMKSATLWPDLTPEPPLVSGPLAVYPLLDDDDVDPDDYLLLSDALEMNLVRVTEVQGGGSVPVLLVENRSELPVLAVQGEELRGARQNRSLNATLLLPPGHHEIPVTCLEQGRWHFTSRQFDRGHWEHTDLRRMKHEMVLGSLRRRHRDPSRRATWQDYGTDQGLVWREIARKSLERGVRSPTAALHDVYEDRGTRATLEELLDALIPPRNARGVVIAVSGRLSVGEVFESATIFARMWPRLSRSYAMSALGRPAVKPLSSADVADFLRDAVSEKPHRTASLGLGEDLHWQGERSTAAGLEWKERLLHGVAFPRG